MSAAYVRAIRQLPPTDVRQTAFKALEELGLAADDDGLTPAISYHDLAQRMRYSPTTAKRRIRDLIQSEFIERLPHILSTVECAGQTLYRYAKNRYRILIEPDRPRFTSARMFTMASWSFFAWLLDKMAQISQNGQREKDLRKRENRPPGDAPLDPEAQAARNLEGIRKLLSALGGSMTMPLGGAP